MNVYLSKSQVKKLLLEHIEEELSTEELEALIVQLIKLYKRFEGSDLNELLQPFLKEVNR
jgi:hypothetical protein